MANTAYPIGKKAILDADVDHLVDTIKCALVDGLSYNAAHDFYDDVSASVIGTPQTLGSKSTTGGKFDAADPTFTAVAGGDTVTGYVIYKDTGTPSTSQLLAFFDTNATPAAISIPTNGGDITIQFDADGIYEI